MTPQDERRKQRMQWLGVVAGVAAGGAVSSLVVGGIIILFVGIVIVNITNGGHTHGNIDHATWLASIIIGPFIVGGCSAGLAAIIRWPPATSKMRTVIALGFATGLMSLALLAGHTNGSIRFLVQPQWWFIYLLGVGALSYLIAFTLNRSPSSGSRQ